MGLAGKPVQAGGNDGAGVRQNPIIILSLSEYMAEKTLSLETWRCSVVDESIPMPVWIWIAASVTKRHYPDATAKMVGHGCSDSDPHLPPG
jgi:hypothetical protein